VRQVSAVPAVQAPVPAARVARGRPAAQAVLVDPVAPAVSMVVRVPVARPATAAPVPAVRGQVVRVLAQ
jgi:hypothetical protein